MRLSRAWCQQVPRCLRSDLDWSRTFQVRRSAPKREKASVEGLDFGGCCSGWRWMFASSARLATHRLLLCALVVKCLTLESCVNINNFCPASNSRARRVRPNGPKQLLIPYKQRLFFQYHPEATISTTAPRPATAAI